MILLTTAVLFACLPQSVLQVQQSEIHAQGIHYSIDIKYPEIENADRFNLAVRQAAHSAMEGFPKEMPGVSGPGVPLDGYLNGTYNAAILKNGIVSVLFDYVEYSPPAAYPWVVMASINYDSRAGRVLALSDLFRRRVNYLWRLSKLAIASLYQNEFADHHAIRDGAGPVGRNFKVFTLTDTALVLHFQRYQVAAGAAGPQSVIIPLDKLAPLLRKR